MKKNLWIIIFGVVIIILITYFTYLHFSNVIKVKFRTSNLYYGATSLISYTETCGSALIKYGNSGEYGTLSGNCDSATGLKNTQLTHLFDVPGKVTSNGINDGKTATATHLYKDSNGILYVCSDYSSGYKQLIYKPITPVVNDSPESIVPTMEVSC